MVGDITRPDDHLRTEGARRLPTRSSVVTKECDYYDGRTPVGGHGRLKQALRASGPTLLYGLRVWASVCLALYVAYRLELDNPFWAGTSAGLVCQPQVGASLRKGCSS